MCKKIAVVGSHSCGKTTMVYKLAAALKELDYSVGVCVEVARLCPYPLNTRDAAEWIILAQIKQELELAKGHQIIICDRTSFDSVIYSQASGVWLNTNLVNFARKHLDTYTEILHLHPKRPIVDDGFRDTDEEFRDTVFKLFNAEFPYDSTGVKISDILKRITQKENV